MSIFEYDEDLHKKTLRAEGYEDGLLIGLEQGGMNKLVTQICRKLAKGKSPEFIAEELEEELATVRRICTVAEQYAPDYDVEAIAKRLARALDYGKRM